MKPIVKNIIIIVVVVIVLAVAYSVFFGEQDQPTGSLVSTTTGTTPQSTSIQDQAVIGQQFLSILLNLRELRLDESLFSSQEFQSLKDFRIPLVQEGNEGRINPFAPLGVDDSPGAGDPVSATEASNITSTSATLNGSVDASIITARKRFEWGETEDFGNTTSIISGAIPTGFFSQEISDLQPGSTYYFRAQALVGTSILSSDTLSFTTLSE